MTTTILCPSGLAGEIRGLRGKEGKLLSDRAGARAGATFEKILAGCWLTTTDPGLYELPASGELDWGKVLVADRFYTLLQIRALTFGNDYTFATQCESPACRQRFEWAVNLQELPVVALSEASKAAFRTGNRFETVLPRDGRKVWFRLLTGADELKVTHALKAHRDGALLAALALRVVEVEGVSDKRKFLDDIEMADAAALLDQFDAADGGVETAIEVECPDCLTIQDIELPFGRSFFLPTSKTRLPTAAVTAE
jgi:hypothetical protein